MENCKGIVNSIESFGSADGPGVRFVVFMQGCDFRCKYCHNPETWKKNGKEYTVDEIINLALKYKSYWGKDKKSGGITVSGGEPLIQIDFLIELFKKAKEYNIHTAIDTSGYPFNSSEEFNKKLEILVKYTDLFLVDIKAYDEELHRYITGHTNKNILEFLNYLSQKNKDVWIRHVLVPTITDTDENLNNIANFVKTLKNVKRVEVLPYHKLGLIKWKNMGLDNQLKHINSPTKEQVLYAEKILCCKN